MSRLDQPQAVAILQIGGVGDGQSVKQQALPDNQPPQLESLSGDLLVGGVVAYARPAFIRGNDLGRQKMFCRKGGLAAPGYATQHNQTIFGEEDSIQWIDFNL
jgi:hypothetical protein